MSDGHFNRSLLPRTDYQSGVRAGRAAAQRLAEEVLARLLAQHEADLPPTKAAQVLDDFRMQLKQGLY